MASDPEDQLRAGELLWVLTRAGIRLQSVPFVVVVEIGNLLADGIAKGLASQTIAMQIAPLLDGDLKRALLIVRTERARAMSGAEYANARDAGDYDKEWMDDEIACPICRANAAQGAISMTQPFSSGDLYPPAHPNCRCALQTVAHHQEKTMAYFVDEPDEDVGSEKAHFSDKPHEVRRIEKAHLIDQPTTFDMLLKSVKADPAGWRRRLGIKPVDHVAMDRKIRDLRAKLAQLEALTELPPRVPTPPPYLYKTVASNGHSTQPRRTRPR